MQGLSSCPKQPGVVTSLTFLELVQLGQVNRVKHLRLVKGLSVIDTLKVTASVPASRKPQENAELASCLDASLGYVYLLPGLLCERLPSHSRSTQPDVV